MKKWDAAIVQAVAYAGHAVSTGDIIVLVLGEPPHRDWTCVSNAVSDACRRGLITRVGGPGHRTIRYVPKRCAACESPLYVRDDRLACSNHCAWGL